MSPTCIHTQHTGTMRQCQGKLPSPNTLGHQRGISLGTMYAQAAHRNCPAVLYSTTSAAGSFAAAWVLFVVHRLKIARPPSNLTTSKTLAPAQQKHLALHAGHLALVPALFGKEQPDHEAAPYTTPGSDSRNLHRPTSRQQKTCRVAY